MQSNKPLIEGWAECNLRLSVLWALLWLDVVEAAVGITNAEDALRCMCVKFCLPLGG